ncbi:MAG: TolC family protein [Planctomycetota bacterium]|jgi:cobalt-zinc-cadmium efflux system outer membrane protein
MKYWKFILLSLLVAVLITGCSEQYQIESHRDTDPVTTATEPLSVVESSIAEQLDISEITEPNGAITLRQALALALMHNPELRAFSWEVRASEARTLQASLPPNPEIEVEVEEVGGTGERSGFGGAEATIQLGLLIELAGKPSKRKRLASLESKLAGWDYEAKRLDVLTEVAHAFVRVLATQEELKLAEELVQLSEQILNTVTQRVEAGKDSPVEKTKAQVALANARIEQKQSHQRLALACKQLAATWGSISPGFEEATGQLDVTSPIPSETELRHLLAQNPDLARWAVEMQRRRAALELEKANAITDPKIFGGMQRFKGVDDTAVVFGLSIPIPTSNRNQGRILEARYNLAKARRQRRAVEANLYVALADAYEALSSALIEVTALKNEVLPGAQSAFDATRRGYREGKFDYLMVLDAQRTFFYTRARYIESLAAYHRTRADVERLIGQRIDTVRTTHR